jgi:hypothetical protein
MFFTEDKDLTITVALTLLLETLTANLERLCKREENLRTLTVMEVCATKEWLRPLPTMASAVLTLDIIQMKIKTNVMKRKSLPSKNQISSRS